MHSPPDVPWDGDPDARELERARQALAATRGVVKSQIRSLRTCLSFIGDLEARLGALEARLDEEADRRAAPTRNA